MNTLELRSGNSLCLPSSPVVPFEYKKLHITRSLNVPFKKVSSFFNFAIYNFMLFKAVFNSVNLQLFAVSGLPQAVEED